MEKISDFILEQYLEKNCTASSKKVYRSYGKKFIICQSENPEIEVISNLVRHGITAKRFLKKDGTPIKTSTWKQIEKIGYQLCNFAQKITGVHVERKIEVIPELELVESSTSIKEGLRQKQEELKLQTERLEQKQKEAKAESVKLEQILEQEAKEFAEKEVIRKEEATKKRLELLFGNFKSEDVPQHYMPFNMEQHLQKSSSVYFEQKNEYKKIVSAIRCGKHIIATGHAGVGKTEVAQKVSHELEGYFFKFGATNATKLLDLIGSKTIDKNQEVKTLAGVITKAILTANKTGKWVICCIDELNCMSERVQKVLNGLCDGTRFLDLPEGRLRINSGAKIVIFGTMNNGYNGTNSVNIELKDRFVFQKFENLPDKILHKIFEPYNVDMELEKKVIQLGKEIDKYQKGLSSNPLGDDARFTTRSMKAFFELHEQFIEDKIPNAIHEALDMVLVEKFDDEVDQKTVRNIIGGIF
tara:strand:- start:2111 stop:3523 length:1413 start_codon:yes stop_codon:yes gene_type:complete